MLRAVLDSFLRAIIRFWNNRFLPKDNVIELYRMEIADLRSRNRELTEFIFNALSPRVEPGESESSEDDFQQLGRPIETTLQRRRRLEQESLSNWNKLVQEAKNEIQNKATTKTTEELEKDLGMN